MASSGSSTSADRGAADRADAPADLWADAAEVRAAEPDSGEPAVLRPAGRPGRKPKRSVPAVVPDMPARPDPDHILTWRQRKVLRVIRDSVQRRGYPPSVREIGEAVG